MSEDPVNEKISVEDLLKQCEEAGIPKAESSARAHKRLSRYTGIYPVPNFAVDVCDRMFAHATEQAIKDGKSEQLARQMGRIAYCGAMPKLSGATNIRDFIACVTYAMALDILPGKEGTQLLYAAQVAHTALTKRPKKRNKSSHTSTAAPTPTQKGSTS